MKPTITSLGEIMQLAYVPADFDATLKFWIETVGAGAILRPRPRQAQ